MPSFPGILCNRNIGLLFIKRVSYHIYMIFQAFSNKNDPETLQTNSNPCLMKRLQILLFATLIELDEKKC
jgi:hypothetical protein